MYLTRLILLISTMVVFDAGKILAQGFGEYGRAVGSTPHGRGITGGRVPGGASQGSRDGSTVTDGSVSEQSLPSRLIVATANAALYPRQDDATDVVSPLNLGDPLVPLVQAVGSHDWFMVKTQNGLVGWVKSTDVRREPVKK